MRCKISKFIVSLLVSFLAAQQSFACSAINSHFGDSRVISADMKQAFGFGSMRGHKQLPLKDKEVVLTFDDGPWHGTTPKILKVLDKYCSHAIFFPIGKHVERFPNILRQVQARGHTIGSHTWSHSYKIMAGDRKAAYQDIMKAAHIVSKTLQTPLPLFFRYPGFKEKQSLNHMIRKNNFVVFSSDVDSIDWRTKSAPVLVKRVMRRLKKKGKGIIIFHDNKKLTANTLEQILLRLKHGGYKIVHVVPTSAMLRVAEKQPAPKAVPVAVKMTWAQKSAAAKEIFTLSALGAHPSLLIYQQWSGVTLKSFRHGPGLSLSMTLILIWLSFRYTLFFPTGGYHLLRHHLARRKWY